METKVINDGILDNKIPIRNNVYNGILTKYKITQDDYNRMYSDQKGKCDICKTHQIDLPKILCVDHGHTTGKVRGLLCNNCNSALGFIKENKDNILNLLIYIQKHKSE